MIQDELEEEYKNETGYSVGTINDIVTTYYSCDFVKWIINKLKKLRVADVSGSALLCCGKVSQKFRFKNKINKYKPNIELSTKPQ